MCLYQYLRSCLQKRDEARTVPFRVGTKAEKTFHLSEAVVRTFAELTGDDNPLHLDPGLSPFPHSVLSPSCISLDSSAVV